MPRVVHTQQASSSRALLCDMCCRQEEHVARVVDDTVARFGTLNTFVSLATYHKSTCAF